MRGGFALAAKAVIIRGDKALVLRRSEKEIKKSYVKKDEPWDLPGGSVRYSESAAECLFREVREETSLGIRIVKPIRIFDAIKSRVHMTILIYVCEYRSGEVRLSEEHEKFYWVTAKEAEGLKLPPWMLRDINLAFGELEIRRKMRNRPRS